jgi:hypothetical protein
MKNINFKILLKIMIVIKLKKSKKRSLKFKLKKMNGFVNTKIAIQSIKLICQNLIQAIVKNADKKTK